MKKLLIYFSFSFFLLSCIKAQTAYTKNTPESSHDNIQGILCSLSEGAPALNQNASCYLASNGSATAAIPTGGVAPYTYQWNLGNTSASRTNNALSAGTYTVTVTDHNGCTAVASITITQPKAWGVTIVSISNISCSGGNNGMIAVNAATGGVPPYTYSWNGGIGTNLTATGLSAGTYTLSITDTHGCNTTNSFTITQSPVLIVTTTVTVNTSCQGSNVGSGSVSASGGTSPYTYIWSTGATTTSISGLSAGTYTVTANDHHGCSGTGSLFIGVAASAITEGNITCFGDSDGQAKVSVTGGGAPYTYSWSPNSNSTYISTGLSAGTYTVVITDRFGCTTTSSTTISQPPAIRDSVASITYPSGHGGTGSATIGAVGGTPPYRYIWVPNVSNTSMAIGITAHTYTVQVKDANGCFSNVTFVLTQPPGVLTSTEKYLNNGQQSNGEESIIECSPDESIYLLYPNPTTGQFTLEGLEKDMTIEIYNYTGKKIGAYLVIGQNIEFNLSDDPDGIYLIMLIDKNGCLVSSKKVLKIR